MMGLEVVAAVRPDQRDERARRWNENEKKRERNDECERVGRGSVVLEKKSVLGRW